MKSLLTTATALVLTLSVAFAQTVSDKPPRPKGSKAEQEITKLYQEWDEALVRVDAGALDRILADGYIFTGEDGTVVGKTASIAALKSGEDVVSSCSTTDIKFTAYGSTVIASGIWKAKQKSKGKDTSGSFRFTDTWIKMAGRWQCVADHLSKAKEEK